MNQFLTCRLRQTTHLYCSDNGELNTTFIIYKVRLKRPLTSKTSISRQFCRNKKIERCQPLG